MIESGSHKHSLTDVKRRPSSRIFEFNETQNKTRRHRISQCARHFGPPHCTPPNLVSATFVLLFTMSDECNDPNPDHCGICFELYERGSSIAPNNRCASRTCRHAMCYECAIQHVVAFDRTTCPFCRAPGAYGVASFNNSSSGRDAPHGLLRNRTQGGALVQRHGQCHAAIRYADYPRRIHCDTEYGEQQ